ncbi:MAG: threonine--tRNA ligase [Methanosarcinaceae archaeon]|nr:threonine--tRNA ligase [Methanosarcinaceae archaeon]
MQILLLHSDFIEYETKKATPVAEKIDESAHAGRLEEALAAFIAVEKDDEQNTSSVIEKATDEIKKTLVQVKADKVMLYPYAHLSSSLSSPDTAIKVLKGIENKLSGEIEVMRAPFGWYKGFTVKCKGHPLSELSKRIEPDVDEGCKISKEGVGEDEDVVSEALKAESVAKSYFKILDTDGVLKDIDDFDLSEHPKLQKFVDYEISKNRTSKIAPPHVELMRKLEIADYENGSDSGNMRFYPKGRLIKSLIERYVVDRSVSEFGAMEVETPIMYDMNHPTLKKYLDRFPARQYSIESDKRHLFLRFAACFGQFLMNHDMTISYRNLPVKMIEMTRYSFRKEQRGELVGLRRLRAFTMPDMHTLTTDMQGATDEFFKQYAFCIDILDKIGIKLDDFEVAIRFTKDFYEDNKDLITKMVKEVNKPVLVEMWDERFFYFVLKFEFNFVDMIDKASALSTVQIDVENAERYDISYTDEKGSQKRPVILHCSPSGAVERCIYALLEKAADDIENKKLPMFPVWLSPTQVRVIPVSEKHKNYAEKICSEIKFRVDLDDREMTLGKKIREAGTEWVPYVIVIGDNELESGKLTVSIRSESDMKKGFKKEMTVEELNELIENETKNLPYRTLPLPKYLSKRAKFV